ncbi:hypothetical protein E4U42_004295, partial [Claviceps africana]
MQTQPAQPVQFEFVTGSRPEQLKADSSRRLRSYLSRRSWQAHRAQQPQKASAHAAPEPRADATPPPPSSGSSLDSVES